MEFREKLLKLRKDLDLTQEDMGDRLGVSGNWVSLLELGKKDPAPATLNHVELMIEAVEADLLPAPGRGPKQKAGSASYLIENEDPQGKAGRVMEESPPYKTGENGRTIPVVSWAHAGEAASYDELPQSWQDRVVTDCRDPKAFAVRLIGDSMEPRYSEGDLLVLQPGCEIHSGCLAVVRLANDGVVFRRVELRKESLRLIALNTQYGAEEILREDVLWAYPLWGMWRQVWR